MSAKEMFEKLGFKEIEQDDEFKESYIEYENNQGGLHLKIVFCLEENRIELFPKLKNGGPHYFSRISYNLLQAINKQVEELGWNNERY